MEKKHISIWVEDEVLKRCDANVKLTKSNNRSEYINEAIDFYNSYLHSQNNEDFVSETLMKMFQSTMDSFEKRMSRQMFKQAVEISKIFWLIAKELKVNPENADVLHESCVQEVKRINGAIQFPFAQKDDR